MGWAVFNLVIGLMLLAAGAEGLVRGSVALALRLGLSRLAVGLTVVAFGTSSPELFTGLSATLEGRGGLVLGNVLGSNICNTGLVLAVAAMVRPLMVRRQALRFDLPVMAACTFLFVLVAVGGVVGRVEGAVLLAAFVLYIVLQIRFARHEHAAAPSLPETDAARVRPRPLALSVAMTAGGIALLSVGADRLVSGAVDIARHFGVGEALIGLTLVALGTSLPELAASVAAARHGEGDLVVGNIIGSNVFNLLAVAGVAAVVRPIDGVGISMRDLAVLLVSALLALRMMSTARALSRNEGALLLLLYTLYMGSLW